MRHGATPALVGVFVILAILIFSVVGALTMRSVAAENASEIIYRYTLAIRDKEVQLLKSGFEKTAVFFSLMSTAKELGLHGGLTIDSLKNTLDGIHVTGIVPPLRFEERAASRMPYWVIPSPEYLTECGQTKGRIPFLRVTDMGQNIGAFPTGNPGESEIEAGIVWNVGGKYDQYFSEVNAGKYELYVLLQVFFIKPGTVTVECGKGCGVITNLTGDPPAPITTDGTYEYKLSNFVMPVTLLTVNMTAKENPADGDGRNVARLKQVVVSIYDKNISKKGNELFVSTVNNYWDIMYNTLDAENKGSPKRLQIQKMDGALYRGEGATTAGIVWSPKGVLAQTDDFIGNGLLLELQSSGVTEDEAKIRYWTMYDYADKFAHDAGDLLRYRLSNRLNSAFVGHAYFDADICGVPSCGDPCPDDITPPYTEIQVYSQIKAELDMIASEYTALSAPGIVWNIELPSDLFKGCTTNLFSDACSAPEKCIADNFEYYEHTSQTMWEVGCCITCTSSDASCFSSSTSTTCKLVRNRCAMDYDHRYVLKNLKISVTITDINNKVFDPATGSWTNTVFKFFVFLPLVDDDDCGSHMCSKKYLSAPKYPSLAPSLSGIAVVTPPPPPKLSPILIFFVKPADGSTVSGDVEFEVSASSTAGPITDVSFFVVPDTFPKGFSVISPYKWTWSTGVVVPGLYKIKAVATDSASNTNEASIIVNVAKAAPVLVNKSVDSITASSASVWFEADQPVYALLEYGTSIAYGSSLTAPISFFGSFSLTGLLSATTYHYRFTLENAFKTSTFVSGDYTFTTK